MTQAKIMGILNLSPDSFSGDSQFHSQTEIMERAISIFMQGADIIDVGGESTRPGAIPVNEDVELERVIPVITQIANEISIPISIDTRKPAVALAAIKAGATIINDVSGFRDPLMCEIAAENNVKICVMHMLGDPLTMQLNPHYHTENVVDHILKWFQERIKQLIVCGVKQENLILDPGIGFGKTVSDNISILQNLHRFKELGYPVLIGLSRKAFIGSIIGKPPQERVFATIAANMFAILQGADFVRVHDVKEHSDAIKMLTRLQNTTI